MASSVPAATQASTLIANAKKYADDMVKAAKGAMDKATAAAGDLTLAGIIPGAATLPDAPKFGIGLTTPLLPPVPFEPPPSPGPGARYQDVGAIDPAENRPDPFRTTAPKTNAPDRPSPLREFKEQMPLLDLRVDFGVAPVTNFAATPVVSAFTQPSRPTSIIQPFDAEVPAVGFTAPDKLDQGMASWYRAAAPEFITMVNGYVDDELTKINPQYHAQLGRIETQLTRYMDGGTGLNPAVENAIYARARGKNDAESRRVRDQALADAATRGFTIPTGALLSATQQARQAGADNNARAAAEIVVMQAEIEQKNLQFAVTTSAGLRTAAVNASLAYMQNLGTLNGQALEYAKGILSAVVETYNIAARVYSARVEGFRAEVSAYDAHLQGVLAGIERYKADIAAEQAKAQVDMSKIQAYTAIINAEQAKVAVYKAHVDAEMGRVSLEKLKVEIFQAQVQSYGAEVQAKSAEWQGYSAAWSGEVSKLNGFRAEVDAYGAQVQGYAAGISGRSAAAQAQAMTNEARAKQYAAELAGYSAAVDAAGKVSTVTLENHRQEIIAFQAQASVKLAELNSYIEYYKATGQIGMEQAKLDTTTMIATAEHMQRQQSLVAQLHNANSTVYANLAGAALAGMNALAVESATMG